jgi:hypothetical protein
VTVLKIAPFPHHKALWIGGKYLHPRYQEK